MQNGKECTIIEYNSSSTEDIMEEIRYLLVDSRVLPPVFTGVITAKELLESGAASSAAQAARMAGISRSAFYKYKDFVFNYSETNADTLSLSARLSDRAGVFSALTTALYNFGANILTVNQELPVKGKANVSLTVTTEGVSMSSDRLIERLLEVDGVISIKINGGKK